VSTFGWVAGTRDPPWQWDLRRAGWTQCRGEDGRWAECRHVLLVDARELTPLEREAIAEADRPAWRLLLLGVEQPAERAALLTRGCAEALPATVSLNELAARARRIDAMFGMLPRWRTVGPLTLDLFHRDARRAGRWLALHPREFGLLWRLADVPGKRVTRAQLLRDVWRLNHEPETNSVEVHVSRLRGKLAEIGCEGLVLTDPRGGYRLDDRHRFMLHDEAPEEDSLDAWLRVRSPWRAEAALEDG
jgi:two-component system OmpR family response regulator